MKAIKGMAVLPAILLSLFIISCENQDFVNENFNGELNVNTEVVQSTAIVYFTETFTISSSKEGLSVSRPIGNDDFSNYESFMITVQNGHSGKTKVVQMEVSLGDVLITHKNFKKNTLLVTMPVTGLISSSILNVKIQGSAGRFVIVTITAAPKSITDIEGNIYRTVKIGDQWWMAENMKTTKFNDGTPIQNVTNTDDWIRLGANHVPAYCWYNNEVSYKDIYGALYNAGVVVTIVSGKNVCPIGWHVPGDEEWTEMLTLLDPELEYGDSYVAGEKLKETGTIHWNCAENIATNETGFSALPGGFRYVNDPAFNHIGEIAIFWNGWYGKIILSCGTGVNNSEGWDDFGLSVRCIKD